MAVSIEEALQALSTIGGSAASGAAAGSVVPGMGTAVGLGVGAAAGILALIAQQYGEEAAQSIEQQALDRYGEISTEAIEDAAREQLGPSAFESLQANPAYKQAGDEALAGLRDVVRSGGMTLDSRVALSEAEQAAAQNEAQNRRAALQSLQSRGLGGNGAELAADLAAGQSGANRVAQMGLSAVAEGRRAALAALQAQGSLARGLASDQWGRDSDVARARDGRDQYNLGYKLSGAQAAFNAQMARANAMAGVNQQQAAGERRSAANTADTVAGLGQAGVNAGLGYDMANQPPTTPKPAMTVTRRSDPVAAPEPKDDLAFDEAESIYDAVTPNDEED